MQHIVTRMVGWLALAKIYCILYIQCDTNLRMTTTLTLLVTIYLYLNIGAT
jgi:hypothetical protein